MDNEKSHSRQRVKNRKTRSKQMQYFPRSHSLGASKSLFSLSVIAFLLLQLVFPCSCSNAKSTNDKIISPKIANRNLNRVDNFAKTTKDYKDVDVVGYGEDCSSDGPYCDKTRHLICDPVDETCICDTARGFVHINDVPGGMEQHLLIEYDAEGNPYYDITGNVCISKQEIIEKTEKLLELGKRQRNLIPVEEVPPPSPSLDPSYGKDVDADDFLLDNGEIDEIYQPSGLNLHTEKTGEGRSIYDEFLKIAQKSLQIPEYDEERVERFKLNSKIENLYKTETELIIEEILRYGRGPINLEKLKPFLIDMLNLHFKWRTKKLSNSICSRIFDIDRDGEFSHEEYVMALLAENVRELVIPKVFVSLIGPLIEESCISKEDLRALDHNPENLFIDFYIMDVDGDGCFSEIEFSKYANETCWVNWLTDFLRETELSVFLEIIDPSPDEMYIRRLLQNEKLNMNWNIVDKDKDGYISVEELYTDLAPVGLSSVNGMEIAKEFMTHLDKNDDGKASLTEVKQQMSIPDLREDYQLEWLESLYELYETDEDDVKEYLEILRTNYGKQSENGLENRADAAIDETKGNPIYRIFTIFDRNRNGEMDEMEFKLLMEMLKKYVVYELLNNTIDSMDVNSDRKISRFEYQEFFKTTHASFRIYFKNLLALEDEIEELENGKDVDANEDEYETWEEEQETEEEAMKVSSTKLSKRAEASNETLMVYKLFSRLDVDSDGFLTNEDFYASLSSYKAKKTSSELKEEFLQLDLNKDGVLTDQDADDFAIPLDFKKFKEVNEAFSGEIFPSHTKSQFQLMDQTRDGVIQKEELHLYRSILFDPDDEEQFLGWIEDYLGKVPIHTEEGSDKAFAEFDTNCDKFISKTEFKAKLDELRTKSRKLEYIFKLGNDTLVYFNSLDLNKDEKVSHNEFMLLLLRDGKGQGSSDNNEP